MTVDIGDIVTAADFEDLRAKMVRILGTPSGTWTINTIGTTAGYNNNINAVSVVSEDLITAADWNLLRQDIIRIYVHINGEEPSGGLEMLEVSNEDIVTAETYNVWETVQSINTTNRNTCHPSQKSLSNASIGSISTPWNGVQTHAFSMTWDSKNHKEGFFNAGGVLRFSASANLPGSAGDKDTDWANIIASIGTIEIKNLSITSSGSAGVVKIPQTNSSGTTYSGWWYIDALPLNTKTPVYTINGGDVFGFPNYDENYYEIQVEKISDTQFNFYVIFDDADTGDQQPDADGPGPQVPGPAVDEDVLAEINSNVFVDTPSGDYVSLPVPTFAEITPDNTLVLA